ncbi:MAG TPA: acetylxylan esterase [Thermomicrobiaceae bacterium]|nr:acetylxylan esterase [Thermomicrobiaceae bacterium]
MMTSEMASAKPADFDEFWEGIDQELARYPARPELEPLPRHGTDFCDVYALRLTSLGPYRIFGYYSVPQGSGPFPALLTTPRYGSVNHVPDYNDRQRYVCLTLMHRGQRLADQPYAAAYPGLLTEGIAEARSYIYRGIAADCLRGAEFLCDRPEVDRKRVAVAGDELALITAARRPGFAVAQAAGLLLYRLAEAAGRSTAYPVEEINDFLRAHPDQAAAVARTLAYFDPRHHAPDVTAATILSLDDEGTLGGLPWLQPLRDALGGPVVPYRLCHEGGTDHDQLDALLAARLDVPPLSRFRREWPS